MTPGTQSILLADLTIDPEVQPREQIDEERIEDFARAMDDGAVFPPICTFYDGATTWLSDGFHRVGARRRTQYDHITAVIREGTREDAILHAIKANSIHGKPLTRAEKRHAIEVVLRLHAEWSDNRIADEVAASHHLVANVREGLAATLEISNVAERVDTRGRLQPAQKPRQHAAVRTTDEYSQDDPQLDEGCPGAPGADQGFVCQDCGYHAVAGEPGPCPVCESRVRADADTMEHAALASAQSEPLPSAASAPTESAPLMPIPSASLTKEQKAFYQINQLVHLALLDVELVADTAKSFALEGAVDEIGQLATWMTGLHEALRARLVKPALRSVK